MFPSTPYNHIAWWFQPKKNISQLQIIIQLLCLKKGCWNPPVIDHAISAHHGELSQFIHASSHLKSQNSFWKWCV
jgi:hypothetical protein